MTSDELQFWQRQFRIYSKQMGRVDQACPGAVARTCAQLADAAVVELKKRQVKMWEPKELEKDE